MVVLVRLSSALIAGSLARICVTCSGITGEVTAQQPPTIVALGQAPKGGRSFDALAQGVARGRRRLNEVTGEIVFDDQLGADAGLGLVTHDKVGRVLLADTVGAVDALDIVDTEHQPIRASARCRWAPPRLRRRS